MPLSVRLKRNLTNILVVFALLAISVILYFFFAVRTQINDTESIVNTLQTSLNVILSAIITALRLLYNLIFTWTIWTLAFFIISVIAVYYFLNQYFIEKKNALIDELTELYNRKAMKIWLKKEINRAARFEHPISVAMIDVDHFKTYNDKNGHVMGDSLLRELAKILKDNSREMDFIGRYGGEEFIIILPETGHDSAVKNIERIRKIVEETKFAGEEVLPEGRLTISLGLATFHKDFLEERMIHEADLLLYEAKIGGRNRLVHRKMS